MTPSGANGPVVRFETPGRRVDLPSPVGGPSAPADRGPWPLHAAVPMVVFTVVVVAGLRAHPFEYDPDEGLNLMKALLVARGHPLYGEIWSDQPPLHTLVLAGVFALTGPSALAARILTAAFSALLVTSLYGIVRRLVSTRAGLIAAGLQLTAAWYPRLSFSVMIGLPALALAMGSLRLLVGVVEPQRSPRASWVLLVLSALLMSAAVATKLFATVVLAAGALLLGVLLVQRGDRRAAVAGTILVWLLVILACCAGLTLLMQLPPADLLGTHVIASRRRGWGGTLNAQHLLWRDWDLLLLSLAALAMVIFGGRRRRRNALVPVLWFASTAVVVQLHRPAWYHHSLLLTLPAAWAGAAVIEELLRLRTRLRGRLGAHSGWTRALTLLLVGFAAWQGVKLATSLGRLFVPNGMRDQQVVEQIRRRAPQTNWAVADRPIYPFAAGLVVPPELAVISIKRRESGKLPGTLVVEVLERYRPEQIVLARIGFGATVMDHVRTHYRPVWEREQGLPATIYLRRDLLPPSSAGGNSENGR